YLLYFVRILIALVFIFSGFVKGIDLLGTAYRFSDYFTAMHLPRMETLSLFLSFLLSGAEFLIGVALLTGIWPKFTSSVALIFMIFFFFLTLILAIFNPVSDCGCFGDAIKMSNWETFYKNVVLLALVVYIFIFSKQFKSPLGNLYPWSVTLIGTAAFTFISIYSYRHLPIIDFMPFKEGNNIIEKSSIPPGAPTDEYATQLLYKNKKTGEVKAFDMTNYPWQDTVNWQWVETKSVLVKKGYTPPIHDFAFYSETGENMTDSILRTNAYVFLVVAYNIEKANNSALQTLDTLAQYAFASSDIRFYAVTASPIGTVKRKSELLQISYSFLTADETLLKTMIRSNPGIFLLHKGTILKKWHYAQFKWNYKDQDVLKQVVELHRKNKEKFVTLSFIFAFIFLFSINALLFQTIEKQRNRN
ncbi:MAG: DoxX family protein, partial [Bacteroidales bacterium]|nr:DoxX family protein [Bacteroidales bacterium]